MDTGRAVGEVPGSFDSVDSRTPARDRLNRAMVNYRARTIIMAMPIGTLAQLSCSYVAGRLRDAVLVLLVGVSIGAVAAHAQDATWSTAPGSGDWNTAANWMPATVPTGSATFGASNMTTIGVSSAASIGTLLFNAGAPVYTFNLSALFFINGTGIVNNSSNAPVINTNTGGQTGFVNQSTAGSATITNSGSGLLFFSNTATGGNANITNNGASTPSGSTSTSFDSTSTGGSATISNINGGETAFNNSSNAGNATVSSTSGGFTIFFNTATAGNANITSSNTGFTEFFVSSTAGNATITANSGGSTLFSNSSTGGNARFITNAGGTFDISRLTSDAMAAGSIEGAGTYNLGSKTLTVGSNNLSTEVSGTIADGGGGGGTGGALIKVGTGTLTLSGTNTYTGGTTIDAGRLVVGDGSATGTIVGAVVNNSSVFDFVNANTAGITTITTRGAGALTEFFNTSTGSSAVISNTNSGVTGFVNQSTAGSATITNSGSGLLFFSNTATGGNANITNNGASTPSGSTSTSFDSTSTGGSATISNINGGETAFNNSSNAGNATVSSTSGGFTIFFNTATAGNANITSSNTGFTEFFVSSTAGNATITANSGGSTLFSNSSTGGNARFITNAGGTFDISRLTSDAMAAGSIEGAGTYNLGSKTLTVGSNNLSTEVSGTIADGGGGGGVGGSLIKVGSGTLTLTGTNNYTGGTTISGGTLQLGDGGASGSIDGNVTNNGTLAFDRSDSFAFGGVISGTGSLVQLGSGTLILTGNSTYSGGTTINAGTLQLGDGIHTASLAGGNGSFGNPTGGSGTDAVTVNNSATFNVMTNASVSGGAGGEGSLGGKGGNGGEAVSFSAGGSLTNSGTISGGAGGDGAQIANGGNGGAAVSFSAGGSLTNSGTISGGAAGTKGPFGGVNGTAGFGVLFSGAAGTLTNLSGGVINGGVTMGNFANAVTLDTGSVINGTLNIGPSTAATLTLDGTGTQLYSTGVTGATTLNGALIKNGTGTWTLDESFTYTGGTTINAGTLNVRADNNLGAASGGLTFDGGTLQWGASFSLSATRAIALEAGGGAFDTDGFNTTIAQGITGSGDLTKAGAGTLTLTGINTYAGGTTISAGTLQLGNGGTSGSITGNVTDNGTLAFDRSDAVTFAGAISGAGSVTQIGTGTTILTGTNTYGGGTTISSGTLQIGNGGTSGSITGNVTDNGTLAFDRSDAVTIGVVVRGTGSLVQLSSGALMLTGNNTYSGGTTISAGTLQIGNGGTSGSIVGNVIDNGNLDFNRSDSVTFSGVISGTGSLVQMGPGTLTLTAANSYGGGTTINTGTTLQLGNGGTTGSIVSNVTDNGSLIFNRSDNVTFNGIISGSGNLAQNGSGTTILGGANTYSGGTIINNGTLLVNNSRALGLGNVVVNGGTLGADPQPINVKGNYTQNAGGTLQLQVAGANPGQYDTLNVGGNAALGGTLQMISLGFQPNGGNQLTLVISGGTVSGRFARFVDPFSVRPGLNTIDLIFGKQSIVLEFLNRTTPVSPVIPTVPTVPTSPSIVPPTVIATINFASFALTPNQLAAANLLDAVQLNPRAVNLISFLDKVPFANLPSDFERISPDGLTAFYEISFSNANIQRLNLEGRMDDLHNGSNGFSSNMKLNGATVNPEEKASVDGKTSKAVVEPILQPGPENRWGVWVTGFGDFVSVDADANANGYNFTTGGVSLGIDYRITDQLAIGVMGEYSHTWTTLQPGGNIDVNSGRGGVYATWSYHGIYLDAAIYGGYNSYDSSRSVLGGLARGNTEGAELSTFISGGYDFHFGPLTVGPIAALQYTYAKVDGFSENGSLAPMQIQSDSVDSLRSDVGFRIFYQWQIGKILVEPSLKAAWEHEYLYSALPVTASFAGIPGPSATFFGPNEGHDSAIVSAGVSVQWTPMIATYVNYDGQLGRGNYDSNAVTGGVRISF